METGHRTRFVCWGDKRQNVDRWVAFHPVEKYLTDCAKAAGLRGFAGAAIHCENTGSAEYT